MRRKKKTTLNVKGLQVNIINSSTSTEGNISCKSNIRFDGNHQGEINAANKIVIGKEAIINGNLNANDIEIFGLVNGDCRAKSSVTLSSSARYSGKICTSQIIIFEGAVFNGNIEMPLKTKGEQAVDKNPQINIQHKKVLQKIALFVLVNFFLMVETVFQINGVVGSNQVINEKNEVDTARQYLSPNFITLHPIFFMEIKNFLISISPTRILN